MKNPSGGGDEIKINSNKFPTNMSGNFDNANNNFKVPEMNDNYEKKMNIKKNLTNFEANSTMSDDLKKSGQDLIKKNQKLNLGIKFTQEEEEKCISSTTNTNSINLNESRSNFNYKISQKFDKSSENINTLSSNVNNEIVNNNLI